MFARISSTDWVEGRSDEQSIQLAVWLKEVGVDLIDCSSGGNVPNANIPVGSSYQIPFAEKIKKEANILTGGVGLITSAEQAEEIINLEQTNIVLLAEKKCLVGILAASGFAAKKLSVDLTDYPKQYLRGK